MLLKMLPRLLASLLLLTAGTALAQNIGVEVVADDGRIFPVFPVESSDRSFRAYLQAERNARYSIRIANHADRRIGLVIAVDGRNVISGQKSHLSNAERMYVLGPHAESAYSGWRTSRDEVHRFYFTSEADSYAEAWGDSSAMGVIAVAVYAEQPAIIEQPALYSSPSMERRAAAAESDAGTGFGEREHSTSVRVSFRPEAHPMEKHFYKYEWHETLCRKNIISCPRPDRPEPPENRFWPEDEGYVPHPPSR